MRLVDLSPKWGVDADIWIGGQHVHDADRVGMGVTFLCPCCRRVRLGVFFENPIDGKAPADDPGNGGKRWTRTAGDSFDTLSLTPSIDASAHGHAHITITAGNVQ